MEFLIEGVYQAQKKEPLLTTAEKKLEDIRSICDRAETVIKKGYIAESQRGFFLRGYRN